MEGVTAASAAEGRSAKGRKLRAEIDKRLLDEGKRFLEAFTKVNEVGCLYSFARDPSHKLMVPADLARRN